MSARPGLCGGYHASDIPTAIVLTARVDCEMAIFRQLRSIREGITHEDRTLSGIITQ